jgi:hypothetical protein
MITGTWWLTSVIQTPNVQGPSGAEQRKLLGTSIVLIPKSLEACGQSVPIKSISSTRVSPDEFLSNTLARFTQFRINAPYVTEIVINKRASGSCFRCVSASGAGHLYQESK